MDRTFRTFDQIRDPETFLVDVTGAEQAVGQHLAEPATQIQDLLATLNGGGAGPTPEDIGGGGTPLPNSGNGAV